MNQAEKYLTPDTFWEGQGILNSIEYYEKFVKSVHLIPRVHIDLQKRIENVKRILFFAYYEYELLDIANEHLLLTMELALKLKYEEIEGKRASDNRKSLKPLLEWAKRQNLLEFPERNKSLEYLRNHVSHPKRYGMAGIAGMGLTYNLVENINGLYEDINVRIKRKNILESVNSKLETWFPEGAVLMYENRRILVRFFKLLYFGSHPHPLHYLGLISIDSYSAEEDTFKLKHPIDLRCESVEFQKRNREVRFITEGVTFSKLIIPRGSEIKKLSSFDESLEKEKPLVRYGILSRLSDLESKIRTSRFNYDQ